MPAFVALSLCIALVVLAFVLRPLWRQARIPTAVIAGCLLLVAAGLYRLIGTPAALDTSNLSAPASLPDAVAQLEAALQRDPTQVEGWRLLGRAYASNKDAAKARDAYARAAALAPDSADVLVEAAESSAMADPQRRFDDKAIAQLQHALQVDPTQQRARWFLGIAQRQAGKAADAAATWEPLLAEVDPATAVPLRQQIDAARRDAGLAPLPAVSTTQMPGLKVRVTLDPGLASRIADHPGASVFIFARAPGGPPMPVAVEKHSVSELPLTTTLDDSDSPMPTQKLSALRDVELIARLSLGGDPIPHPGDLESAPVHVHMPTDKTIDLTIASASR